MPSTAPASRPPREPIPAPARKAAAVGFAGTFIEYFDFALYGTLAVFLAPQFFPASNTAASLLATLAVFGAGFVVRPIGGIVFGRIGDRRGRRAALVLTIVVMGLSSGLVGLLPTFASVGVLAPVLLVVLRLGQGLSAGAEMLGSVTFVLESAPPSRRAFLASFTPLGSVVGGASAGGIVALLASTLPAGAMAEWGWRIPFLLAFPLALLAYLLRRRMEDSPEFASVREQGKVVRSPLGETLRSHWRAVLVAGGIAIAANGAVGMAAWFAVYLAGNRQLPVAMVTAVASLSGVVAGILVPVAGRLSDRLGQRRMILTILVAYIVLVVPILALLSTATAPALLFLGLIAFAGLGNLLMVPAFAHIAQMFPAQIRYTAANLGQNIGTVLGSGIAPLVAGTLLLVTGSGLGPAIWVIGTCLIALVTMWAGRGISRRAQSPGDEPVDAPRTATPLPEG